MKSNYYAVIFSSVRTNIDDGYEEIAKKMIELAKKQKGFIDYESAIGNIGISISYWEDLKSIEKWKNNIEHQNAIKMGKEKWYNSYKVRIAKIEKEYLFEKNK